MTPDATRSGKSRTPSAMRRKNRSIETMTMKTNLKKQASRYVKIVEWSDEDGCFIGRCPELFHGGTHGDDEAKVYADLCEIVEEVLGDMEVRKEKLPATLAGQKFSG